jgi:site-specific DNA-methyltransferase (adenine-specific)
MNKKSTKAKRPVVARKVEPVVVRLSDSVTLIHGDCRDCLPIEADAVISDPPYGIAWDTGYDFGLQNSSAPHAKNLVRKKHKPIAGDAEPFDPAPLLGYRAVVLWGCNYFMEALPSGGLLVWDKRTESGKAFMSEAEAAWCNRRGRVQMFSHCWQGFSRASENSQHYHPTQKPVALMEWCMDRAKVPQGATVLDPYMGSGTTGIACIRTGRKFIGIEIDAGHFETARKRIEAELMQGTFDFSGGASAPTHNAEAHGRRSRTVQPIVGSSSEDTE